MAKQQPVELGLEQRTKVEIIKGLNPSDHIVVSGLQTIGDGAPIRPQEQE